MCSNSWWPLYFSHDPFRSLDNLQPEINLVPSTFCLLSLHPLCLLSKSPDTNTHPFSLSTSLLPRPKPLRYVLPLIYFLLLVGVPSFSYPRHGLSGDIKPQSSGTTFRDCSVNVRHTETSLSEIRETRSQWNRGSSLIIIFVGTQ